jgi:hypothetical protein
MDKQRPEVPLRFVQKPISADELLATLRELLAV